MSKLHLLSLRGRLNLLLHVNTLNPLLCNNGVVHSVWYPHVAIRQGLCYLNITQFAITHATKRLPAYKGLTWTGERMVLLWTARTLRWKPLYEQDLGTMVDSVIH